MENNFTPRASDIFASAVKHAANDAFEYVYSEHVFLSILNKGKGIGYRALAARIDIKLCKSLIKNILNSKKAKIEPLGDAISLSDDLFSVINTARSLSFSGDTGGFIGADHLLLALLSNRSTEVSKMLTIEGVDLRELNAKLVSACGIPISNVNDDQSDIDDLEMEGATCGEEGDRNLNELRILQQFGVNLVEKAMSGDDDLVIGREQEINQAIRTLCRKRKNCPVLVGDAGVGKTAIAHGIAQRIACGNVPHQLKNKVIFEVDMGLLVAGTKYRGQFEERIKKLMQEVVESKDVIVFVDEIHTMIGAGGAEGSIDASNMLKPALARGDFPCIGATTYEEYRKYIERDGALERRFNKVNVLEPSDDAVIEMLKKTKKHYEEFHNVILDDDLLESIVSLSKQFITEKNFPDKAFDVVDESCVFAHVSKTPFQKSDSSDPLLMNRIKQLEKNRKYDEISELKARACITTDKTVKPRKKKVSINHVCHVVSGIARIPVENVLQSTTKKYSSVIDQLKRDIIGQDSAIKDVSDCLIKSKTPLKDTSRPIGSFLFLGATGVGKTLLAKNIATHFFGHSSSLVRFDMSEYQTHESVNKLIGGSPSYVGYESGGQLVNAIRNNPHTVVLFDEIEKAHSEVVQILLQVMEDGFLTDNKGKRANFNNCVIILTSNVGGQVKKKEKPSLGFGESVTSDEFDYDAEVRRECKKYFSDEFLNRLSKVVVFNKLESCTFEDIVKTESSKIVERLSQHNISLSLSKKVMKALAEKGFSEEYGAREVRRVLEREIENVLVDDFVNGKIVSGNKIKFDVKKGKISYLIS